GGAAVYTRSTLAASEWRWKREAAWRAGRLKAEASYGASTARTKTARWKTRTRATAATSTIRRRTRRERRRGNNEIARSLATAAMAIAWSLPVATLAIERLVAGAMTKPTPRNDKE